MSHHPLWNLKYLLGAEWTYFIFMCSEKTSGLDLPKFLGWKGIYNRIQGVERIHTARKDILKWGWKGEQKAGRLRICHQQVVKIHTSVLFFPPCICLPPKGINVLLSSWKRVLKYDFVKDAQWLWGCHNL